MKGLYGDTADITQPIEVNVSPGKLIHIIEKFLTLKYSGKSYLEKLGNVLKKFLEAEHLDRPELIKAKEFICFCVKEYKSFDLSPKKKSNLHSHFHS